MTGAIGLKGKRLLLAEDEASFAASLKSVLENAGMEVVIASDGEIAKRLVDAEEYAIVLSDIRMPKVTGIDLLQHVQAKQPKLPVVLMTGFSELADAKKAAELGAKGFLNKPFRLKDLTDQLEKILNQTDEEWTKKDENFSALRIEEFLAGQDIKYEIFVKVEGRGFVRIAAEGSTLSKPQVKVLKERGLRLLYIRKTDLLKFIGLNWEIKGEIGAHPALERARLRLNEMETQLPHPIDGFESASEMTYAMLEILILDPTALQILNRMEAMSPEILDAGLRVSVFSILVARAAGLKSPRVCARFALAGLLHDAGLTDLPKEVALADPNGLTSEQRKTYELHAHRSSALAAQVAHIPAESIQAIEQHHEECGGKGFPAALRRPAISSMARILFIGHEFCRIAFPVGKPANLKSAVGTAIVWRDERHERFDAEYVKAFVTLLSTPSPQT